MNSEIEKLKIENKELHQRVQKLEQLSKRNEEGVMLAMRKIIEIAEIINNS